MKYFFFLLIAIQIGLAIWIILTNFRSKINQIFSLMILGVTLWTLGIFYIFKFSSPDVLVWSGRATFASGAFAVWMFCYFATIFPRKIELPKWLRFSATKVIHIAGSIMTLLSLTPLVISLVTVTPSSVIASHGILYIPYILSVALYILFGLTILFYKLINLQGRERLQIQYVCIGFGIFMGITLVTNVLFPLITKSSQLSQIGPTSSLFLFLSIAYAIARFRLFNTQIQLQKTVNSLIPVLLSSIATLFLAFLLYQKLHWDGGRNGIILLIFYTLTYKVFNYLFTKTNLSYLLFRRTYHFHQSLIEFSNRASDIAHFDTLVKELQQTFISSRFVHAFAFFVITDQNKKSCHVYETHNINPAELAICAESVLHPFLHRELITSREPLVIDELVYSNKPELQELKAAFHPLDGGVCIPLFVSNDLAGLILLGPKERNGAYTIEDIKVFEEISTPLAVAVTKALLFTHYHEQVIELSRDKRNLEESITELKRMKNEFLTIVDHQFNTPLSIIESAFAMIQDGDVPLEEIQEYVTSMAPRIQEFKQIIEDMLRAAHFEGTGTDLKFSLLNVRDCLSSLVEKNQLFANEHGVSLSLQLPSTLPRITSDPEQFQVALSHILRNAIIYGEQKPVTISTELTKEDQVLITISDQGRGFTSDESGHFGEKFFRGKDTVNYLANGSGLGLFIAKKIIEASGGKLSWKSPGPGLGATFEIELPKGSEFVKTRPVMPE